MEYLRAVQKGNVPLDEVNRQPKGSSFVVSDTDNIKEIREKMLSCLDHCTSMLEPLNREIILRYYSLPLVPSMTRWGCRRLTLT